MIKRLAKGYSAHAYCDQCQATFYFKPVYPTAIVCTDFYGKCLFCEILNREPTKSLSQEEIELRKQQIRERLK